VASRYAILAADRQYAVLRHRLAQEELQLVKLSSNAEHGSKQINAQQRRIAGIHRDIAQYRSQVLLQHQSRVRFIAVYHSLMLILAATLGAAPWTGWHFSLRTLLIATAVVAVLLGLIVWAAR
jgi:hypothetical protein